MNIKDHIYLDYNATAPLALSFISALKTGEIPFANPSSQHTLGKESHRYIESVKEYLFSYFNLSKNDFNILFHSGATEASNTFFSHNSKKFLYFNCDHACITSLATSDNSIAINPNKDGSLSTQKVIEQIKEHNCSWLHMSWVNNETGVVNPLAMAEKIKTETNCLVYVDAVQSVGKIDGFNQLNPQLDVYSFSGHKFGALKGIGFSFIRKDLEFSSLILGGGQQSGKRSGTLNIHGIASLMYALKEIELSADLKHLKEELRALIAENTEIKIIANTSYNTLCFVHNSMKADMMLIHFDMAGLAVSSGSACSSGSITESKTLLSMGFEGQAYNGIRISLGPKNLLEKEEILIKMKQVLRKL